MNVKRRRETIQRQPFQKLEHHDIYKSLTTTTQ